MHLTISIVRCRTGGGDMERADRRAQGLLQGGAKGFGGAGGCCVSWGDGSQGRSGQANLEATATATRSKGFLQLGGSIVTGVLDGISYPYMFSIGRQNQAFRRWHCNWDLESFSWRQGGGNGLEIDWTVYYFLDVSRYFPGTFKLHRFQRKKEALNVRKAFREHAVPLVLAHVVPHVLGGDKGKCKRLWDQRFLRHTSMSTRTTLP